MRPCIVCLMPFAGDGSAVRRAHAPEPERVVYAQREEGRRLGHELPPVRPALR